MSQLPFTITRIRLINFHNFTDEIITIPNNGHLFLLGDNGCGKTTVLDAIHYVLTAGHSMEWNSAARVTGRRDGGRRLQGVILRYNIETGVMNRNGSITYAAVEISGRHGRPLTIGLGLSVSSMDEQVRPWGVIRECPLEDIPFLVEDENGNRPASRHEFKQALGKSRGFQRDATIFRREMAHRLFGGTDTYHEICRFLKMGKAYREIAAGAADYHELFKQLLPEPHTAIFEEIIEGLRTIDNSRTLLEDLQRKTNYVQGLQEIIVAIGKRQEAICRYDWLLCRWNLHQNKEQQQTKQADHKRLTTEQHETEAKVSSLDRQHQQLSERLSDLKAKDNSGLVRQEKSCSAELAEKKATLTLSKASRQEAKKQLRQAGQKLQRHHKELQKRLAKTVSECGRRSHKLPFPITSLQQKTDHLFRHQDIAGCLQLEANEVMTSIEGQLRQLNGQSVLLTQENNQVTTEINSQEKSLEALLKQETPQPQQEIYPCIRSLSNKMIQAKPLYLGLEWLVELSQAEQDKIEETIGEDILATLLVRDSDYASCRELITAWPGIRISCPNRAAEDIHPWMRSIFDIQQSDPTALRCLAAEMESGNDKEPTITSLNKTNLLAFRSHERTLYGNKSRLIGEISRKQALATEIAFLEKDLKQLRKTQQKLHREQSKLANQQDDVTNFRQTLSEQLKAIHDQAHTVDAATNEHDHCQERYNLQQERFTDLGQEVTHLSTRQQELKTLISKEGLAGLEQRINQLDKQAQATQGAINTLNKQLGAIELDQKQNRLRLTELDKQATELQTSLDQKNKELQDRLPDIADMAHYVLKIKTGHQFTSSAAISKKRQEAEKQALQLIPELKVKLNDPEFGAAFRFSYDEGSNQLHDFRSRALAEILPEQEQAVREQQELINDHTRELFTKIIMTDLMNYLRRHVSELEQMMRRINSLLANRSFGGQRYKFRVRPLDNFKRLVKIIKKHSSFDPEADKEVRHFFEDHQEEIMAAEVGAVPDELDYRNWYRYELEVSSLGDEGVVMDRTTKSMGSGGEQAVPNYLLILTIAHFLYQGKKVRLHTLLFDEAFYGIDAGRRDQLLGFATDLNLQLFVASPDQDGVRREISHSTTLFVVKDKNFDIHLRDFHWQNPNIIKQVGLFDEPEKKKEIVFGEEI